MGANGVGLQDKNIEALLFETDTNKDGVIDYNEFLEMMKRDLRSEMRSRGTRKLNTRGMEEL